nr:uncharacterized protein LOC124214432 [Neodiprion pinetum]
MMLAAFTFRVSQSSQWYAQANFEYRVLCLLDPALQVCDLVKLGFRDKRSVVSTLQVRYLVRLEIQDKRYVVSALQVGYLDKRSVVSALEVRYLMKLDFREKRYVGFPLQIRCPLNLDSRGMRWTRRTRISARYNPRWSSVVVGGGWLWLEVDEKEDQEDKENKVVEDDEDSCTVQPEVVIGGCSRCSKNEETTTLSIATEFYCE